jgi:transcription elongation factor Elf1
LDADPDAKAAAVALALRRGVGAPDTLDGKRLVKALLSRTGEAQVRLNPIHRDEAFNCLSCGEAVQAGGAQVRDHCPHCLHGLHVDCVPGDRAADCGGDLSPISFGIEGRAGVVITYGCGRCRHQFRVRAHPDDRLPKGLSLDDG